MSALPDKKEETPERKEYAVTVLSRVDIVTYPKIEERLVQVRIIYVAEGLAPKGISILKDEYSLEVEKERIRADIEQRLEQKAEAYKV